MRESVEELRKLNAVATEVCSRPPVEQQPAECQLMQLNTFLLTRTMYRMKKETWHDEVVKRRRAKWFYAQDILRSKEPWEN